MRGVYFRLAALALLIALVAALLPAPAHARQGTCGTAPQPRLTVGQQARVTVTNGTGSNLRGMAGTGAVVMGVLADGEVFTVIGGPQCAENYWWWQLRRTTGQEGWTAEGITSEYWVEPWPPQPGVPAPVSMGERANLPGVQIAYHSGTADLLTPNLMNADGSMPRTLAAVKSFDNRLVWSPNGQWVAFTDGNDLYIASQDGAILTNLTNSPGVSEYWPAWAPDSTRLAYVSQAGDDMEIHMRTIDGLNAVNLTNHPARDGWPAWSPDGTRIAFSSDRGGSLNIYTMNAADGSNVGQVTQDDNDNIQATWSPDGLDLAFLSLTDTFSNLMVIQPPFSATIVMTEANVTDFVWSPDSRRLAYIAETPVKSGVFELFTTRSDLLEPIQMTVFGRQLAGVSWSPDGEYLAFASNSAGAFDIYTIRQGGYGLARLTDNALLDTFPVFTPSTAAIQLPAGATPGPAQAVNPADQDLLLIYDAGVPVFTLQNVSGVALNLQPLSFEGAGRTVSMDIWTDYLPATSPITSFQAGGCLMLWPFGIPDQPTPPQCGQARQGWITDSSYTFWNAGSFVARYNGAVVATCDSAALTCYVNLP